MSNESQIWLKIKMNFDLIDFPSEKGKFTTCYCAGGTYFTCPCCVGGLCYCASFDGKFCEDVYDKKKINLDPTDEMVHVCSSCGTMFKGGCDFFLGPTVDSKQYAQLVESFTFRNVKCIGQPKFDVSRKENNFKPESIKHITCDMTDIKFKCTCFLNGCQTEPSTNKKCCCCKL